MQKAKNENIKYVKLQDFETAAEFRQIEKECKSYIEIKTEYNIRKSMFYFKQNYLFYFYFGTDRNDKQIKLYFEWLKYRKGLA